MRGIKCAADTQLKKFILQLRAPKKHVPCERAMIYVGRMSELHKNVYRVAFVTADFKGHHDRRLPYRNMVDGREAYSRRTQVMAVPDG